MTNPHLSYEQITTRGGSEIHLRLGVAETELLGEAALHLAAGLDTALRAMAELRAGAWDHTVPGPHDDGRPRARQRQRMSETVHALARDLIPRLEAIQAATLRRWKAEGASYAEIASAMGLSNAAGAPNRATAQSRLRALEDAGPSPLERWACGPITHARDVCDHTSIGVIVTDEHGRYLLIQRAEYPHAWAPTAGHVDDHGNPGERAREAVAEETGLTVGQLEHVTGGWRPNRCCRLVRQGRTPGHYWTIYRAIVTGEPAPSADKTRVARWVTGAELQALADRTAAYARGKVTETEWAASPGLEDVWRWWLRRVGILDTADVAR
ncbi:NUDIX domain-containing protein [Nonomuraea sp. NPDC049152]|uniref:NUDIX domain-containing protein n=1 Tax=Nonomuraea sp. NPDC049152 TaxID=3154350 RepID=UPI0033F6AF20